MRVCHSPVLGSWYFSSALTWAMSVPTRYSRKESPGGSLSKSMNSGKKMVTQQFPRAQSAPAKLVRPAEQSESVTTQVKVGSCDVLIPAVVQPPVQRQQKTCGKRNCVQDETLTDELPAVVPETGLVVDEVLDVKLRNDFGVS